MCEESQSGKTASAIQEADVYDFPNQLSIIAEVEFVSKEKEQGSHFFGMTKFHDFSSKFPGIFFIIFKVWLPSGFEHKYANLLSSIWTKN